jgi:pimeloyl-ACP methyl ester carboxylesterase
LNFNQMLSVTSPVNWSDSKTRKLAVWLSVLVTAYLGISAILGVVLMEGALHLQRRPVPDVKEFQELCLGSVDGPIRKVTVTAADQAQLIAWYARPAKWNGSSIILLHGVGDNRFGVAGYAKMFLWAGYAVLLPDSRAHGQSDGPLTTYGLLESEDVRRWALWLKSNAQADPSSSKSSCTFLFGESMGAAIAIQATASTSGVCAVVAEAPFSSFREIAYDRISQQTGLNLPSTRAAGWPVVQSGFLYARLRYQLDFERANPAQILAQSRVPLLLIAGLADTNIPVRHSEEILKMATGDTRLWRVPGAGHTAAESIDATGFDTQVLDWFATHSHPVS